MNTKQIKIQKEIGEHIAALHSLYEEFKRADDSFNNPTTKAMVEFAKLSPKKMERIEKQVIKLYAKKKAAA